MAKSLIPAPFVLALAMTLAIASGCAAKKEPVASPPASRQARAGEGPEGRPFDPARVAELAEFVTAMRGHPFKRPLPPVVFVPQSRLPDVSGAQGPLQRFTTSGKYLADLHRIVIADRYASDPDLEPIVVHELVHALMFDYGITTPSISGTDDEKLFAVAARIEGEADLVEYAFRGKSDGRQPRRAMASLTNVHEPYTPLACRSDSDPSSCAFRAAIYSEGRAFASALYRAGGTKLLDAAHERAPTTMLEILYPDLYLRGDKSHELSELTAALEAAGHSTFTRAHLGAFHLAETLARNGADADRIRVTLHGFRGDEIAVLPRGQVIATEWADEESAKRMLDLLAKTKLRAVAVAPRRVLFGINVTMDVVSAAAKKLAPKTVAPGPKPFDHVIAPGIPPWQEELASALRLEGTAALRRAGIEPGSLRAEAAGPSHVWLSSEGEKLFVFPTAVARPSDRIFTAALGKAWSDVSPPISLDTAETHATPLGVVHLWRSNFGASSSLHFALARVPLCDDPTSALLVVQFGVSGAVKDALAKNLAGLRRTQDPKSASLCRRLSDEAAVDFVPPTSF